MAPGSFVRSSTAIARTDGGSAASRCAGGEGPEQPDLHEPDRSPRVTRPSTASRAAPAPDPISTMTRSASGRTGVLDQSVAAAGSRLEARHRCVDHIGHALIEEVGGLAHLEVDIRVLRRPTDERMVRVERPPAVRGHEAVVHERPEIVVREQLDAVDLVRGAEAIEEVEKRYA